MIRKIVFALSALVVFAGNAQAGILDDLAPKGSVVTQYVGGDLGISVFNGTALPFNIHAGVDITRKNEVDFGAEVYGQLYTSSSHYVLGLDALVYPIAKSDINWFGGAGLSYHRYASSVSEFGVNVLGGARYNLSKTVSVRARAKYFIAPRNLDLTIGADYRF